MSGSDGVVLKTTKYRPQPLTWYEVLNFCFVFIPGLLLVNPLVTVFQHYVNPWSRIRRQIGRPFLPDLIASTCRYLLERATPAQARIVFNSHKAYDMAIGEIKDFKEWVTYEKVAGIGWRIIAPPGSKRDDDDVVMYFIHGGGFVFDSGGNTMKWHAAVSRELHKKRGVRFCIYALDYSLSPDFIYPTQLIQILAGYHHLVNRVGIAPSKICLAGDSAGGNLVATLLLHLARPTPEIQIPAELGATPPKPGRAMLISPLIDMLSTRPSRTQNGFNDPIEHGGAFQVCLDYIGAERPDIPYPVPSWNPLIWFRRPFPSPPLELVSASLKRSADTTGDKPRIGLLASPYVNPAMCYEDADWWREAMPGSGATLVSWGGKEILGDDVKEFVDVLNKAGVAPKAVCKPLAHDWQILEVGTPGLWKTHARDIVSSETYGVDVTVDFLEEMFLSQRKGQ